MKLKLEIRRNSDGVIATDVWKNWDYNEYWWKEGNAACDCNREQFFLEAMGEEAPDDLECGDSRFLVRLSDATTGKVLYNEFDRVNLNEEGRENALKHNVDTILKFFGEDAK